MPSRLDPCRPADSPQQGQLWALPITSAPAGLGNIEPGAAANLGFPPKDFRRIVLGGLAESIREGAPYLAVVVRSDVGQDLQLARFTVANLAWLAGGGAGYAPPRFVGPRDILRAVGGPDSYDDRRE